jgi:hypothetical protein
VGSKRWWLGALTLLAVVTAIHLGTGHEEAPFSATVPVEIPPTVHAATPAPEPELADLGDVELGLIVWDRRTGQDVYAHDEDREFQSASLVKMLIALNALELGEPPSTVDDMLSTSDDEVANRLWDDGGDADIVNRWARRIGLTGTLPPDDPEQWGETRTTARDVAEIYRYLFDHPNGETVLKGLHAMADFGSDGFDQRFGVPTAADGRPWAAKQGWACCTDQRTLHTTGLVGADDRYVVVVLTTHPIETTWESASEEVTRITAQLITGL